MEQFNFAGFTWPRKFQAYNGRPEQRRGSFRADGRRAVAGPYYLAPQPGSRDGWSFYLDSDFMPGLRWNWCDRIDNLPTRIPHYGWYSDDEGMGETIRGIVLRLPRGRGFLAGWSMGEGTITSIEPEIYPSEVKAAYAADYLAERAAEREREYQRASRAECDIDMAADQIARAREGARELIAAIRAESGHVSAPPICDALRARLAAYRREIWDALETIKEARETLEIYGE